MKAHTHLWPTHSKCHCSQDVKIEGRIGSIGLMTMSSRQGNCVRCGSYKTQLSIGCLPCSQSTGSNQPAAGRTAAQDDGLQAQLYRG